MINILVGLVCVMLANVVLGITLAKLKKEFKTDKLLNGMIKYLSMVVGVCLMCLAGNINPDVMVANINGIEMNLNDAMSIVFISGMMYYAYQDLMKLKKLLGVSKEIDPNQKG